MEAAINSCSDDDPETIHSSGLASRTPTKERRSLSDVPPMLSPSPKFQERVHVTKDDIAALPSPITPRRPPHSGRGLSLQVPVRDVSPHSAGLVNRIPLSPKLDPSNTYGSPGSVLPRRSRGLDFSRACTSLHHSTLAEQSSPDLSPTVTGKPMTIPNRRCAPNTSGGVDLSISSTQSLWSTAANPDKARVSSSIGSIDMLESDSSASSSDGDELMDPDDTDPIITTPQVYKLSNPSLDTPHQNTNIGSGLNWGGIHSPAVSSLMSFQRARLRRKGKKVSSSPSLSGSSSMPSPIAASPPLSRGTEGFNGYFARDQPSMTDSRRRSSLSMGAKELRISSSGESDDGTADQTPRPGKTRDMVPPATPGMDEKRGVIRRAVTRRGNLLPKTKNFARIQAALMEEGAPVDTEVKREAEVVRQVRESDGDVGMAAPSSLPPTADSSPSLLPTVPGIDDPPDDEIFDREEAVSLSERSLSECFSAHVQKNSGGRRFWERFESGSRTPPPPLFTRAGSSVVSDDMTMESPLTLSHSLSNENPATLGSQVSGSTTQPLQPSVAEMSRKINNKRRHDDDFDISSLKRRAVSPGVSVQNSPILAQSPAQKDGGWWGLPKGGRDGVSAPTNGQTSSERANSAGSVSSVANGAAKRVGLQGMNDTHDGLMNMSIE
ncbi:MAG: hypothetical protein M1817_003153 [Caeruleum heppii]|nr:MAG: hypothetical protein M1817_003153 [Caeruleum heppii]